MKITIKRKNIIIDKFVVESKKYLDTHYSITMKKWPFIFLVVYEYNCDRRCYELWINDKVTNTKYLYKNPSQRKCQRALFKALMSKSIWLEDYMRENNNINNSL